MSVCQVLPAQKAQLRLLVEMGILTKSALSKIERKGQISAAQMQDNNNEFGRDSLFRAMSPQTFAAFNIRVNTIPDVKHSSVWNKMQVKQGISIQSQKLTTTVEAPKEHSTDQLKGMQLPVFLLMDEGPSDCVAVVAKLFDGYKMQPHEIFMLDRHFELGHKSFANFSDILNTPNEKGLGVAFALWSKAHESTSKKVGAAYKRVKAYCGISAQWVMMTTSVSRSLQVTRDADRYQEDRQRFLETPCKARDCRILQKPVEKRDWH